MSLQSIFESSDTASPSAVQSLLTSSETLQQGSSCKLQRQLALQIAHNLRYQHDWTDLRIHSVLCGEVDKTERHLLSGLPPERLYVHPDEQIALLQQQKSEGKTGMPKLSTEREWIVPSHLREKWTLRRFGETFDGVSTVPDADAGTLIDLDERSHDRIPTDISDSNPWRKTKRFLLATLDDDSTIVYYIVHDGIVKPRQN